MLRKEAAAERLKQFAVPDGEDRRLAAVAALPESLRSIGYAIMHRDEAGKSSHDWSRVTRAMERLETLYAPARLELFAALFPTLARPVDLAWQRFPALPYQHAYNRRAFRAPYCPALLRERRGPWLHFLFRTTADYEQDITWYAAWAPYLGYYADGLGLLFAAVIDAGGQEGEQTFQILLDSARGEHEVGAMGRHVSRALLSAARPDGWEFVEKMMLAAQRQEGLRQTILETVDEAHPEAFRRMLRLLLDHDLLRFSAVTRAVGVWTGMALDALSPAEVRTVIAQLHTFLTDAGALKKALRGDDPQATYLALLTMACEDVEAAAKVAAPLIHAPRVEVRFVVASLMQSVHCPAADAALLPALDDPDLRVAQQAVAALRYRDNLPAGNDCFERLERLLTRLPAKEIKLEPLVWPWTGAALCAHDVASGLIRHVGVRAPQRLLPYLPRMDGSGRAGFIRHLTETNPSARWDAPMREALYGLVGDSSSWISNMALEALASCQPDTAEAQRLEGMLTRKTAEVRQAVMKALLTQETPQLLASIERLLAASKPEQRVGGLEMARILQSEGRCPEERRAMLERHMGRKRKKSDMEQRLLEELLQPGETPTRANGLGLFDPAQRTLPLPPIMPADVTFITAAAVHCLESLLALIHAVRERPVTLELPNGPSEMLFGDILYGFPQPQAGKPLAEDMARLPLREVWETWERERPAPLRDPDGHELLRALAALNWLDYLQACQSKYGQYHLYKAGWYREAIERLYRHEGLDRLPTQPNGRAQDILKWLLRLTPQDGAASYLLDAMEASFALVPQTELERAPDPKDHWDQEWRDNGVLMDWCHIAGTHYSLCAGTWSDADLTRLWRLLCWRDRPVASASRRKPGLSTALSAHRVGAASEADLLDLLLGERDGRSQYSAGSNALWQVSTRKPTPLCVQYPLLPALVERCRQRIIEVEVGRGELPTPASSLLSDLRYSGGLETLARVIAALGTLPFARGHNSDASSQTGAFSYLVRCTFPGADETPERFAQRMREVGITPQRLVELAVYAPQWAAHVEQALTWPGLEEGVWWLHAHTKDEQWRVQPEIKESWSAELTERTPLLASDLLEGAVDVAWFQRAYATLGPERWSVLDEAAKYAASGAGHNRARLFADAMLGRRTRAELLQQIAEKRHQDALRALGLVPLAGAGSEREADLLERYRTVQEFMRGSKQFGAQKQASERLAASIALQNLARTAGFPDPVRLEWAMEAAAVADLANGPVTVMAGEVAVSLAIDPLGQPQISVMKGGKALKSVPPAAKKEPAVAALLARHKEIEQQGARIRRSLEQAMCRGDRFTARELEELLRHPVLRPMLRALIFCGDGAVGYPAEGGRALEGHDGRATRIHPETPLRIAHPYDLLHTEEWAQWQRDCFLRERVQPFKQAFRELYVLTQAEMTEGHSTRRYEGHQVNPRQALALLGRCGWVSRQEEGVSRTFHEQGLTAWLTFEQGAFTPAEVEGLTVEGLWFTRKGETRPIPLPDVPPRLFSEAMRDLDLMASVAHVGGVDPEASRSTVEMREALVRQAADLLKLNNLRYQGQHVLIDGQLGTYSVHLGSALVHRQPGGHLCIVPVHSQHRGRLFLPFADNDPKTAEVVSKVLLLARDTEIKDPSILEQILSPV
jgi:hypothetical protein